MRAVVILGTSGFQSFPRKPFDFAHGPELAEGRESSFPIPSFQGLGPWIPTFARTAGILNSELMPKKVAPLPETQGA